MLTAIHFDHHTQVMAGKVCKVRTDGGLSPKVSALGSQRWQMLPQLALGVGDFSPQLARAGNTRIKLSRLIVCGHAAAPHPPPPPPPHPPPRAPRRVHAPRPMISSAHTAHPRLS